MNSSDLSGPGTWKATSSCMALRQAAFRSRSRGALSAASSGSVASRSSARRAAGKSSAPRCAQAPHTTPPRSASNRTTSLAQVLPAAGHAGPQAGPEAQPGEQPQLEGPHPLGAGPPGLQQGQEADRASRRPRARAAGWGTAGHTARWRTRRGRSGPGRGPARPGPSTTSKLSSDEELGVGRLAQGGLSPRAQAQAAPEAPDALAGPPGHRRQAAGVPAQQGHHPVGFAVGDRPQEDGWRHDGRAHARTLAPGLAQARHKATTAAENASTTSRAATTRRAAPGRASGCRSGDPDAASALALAAGRGPLPALQRLGLGALHRPGIGPDETAHVGLGRQLLQPLGLQGLQGLLGDPGSPAQLAEREARPLPELAQVGPEVGARCRRIRCSSSPLQRSSSAYRRHSPATQERGARSAQRRNRARARSRLRCRWCTSPPSRRASWMGQRASSTTASTFSAACAMSPRSKYTFASR